MCVESCAVNVDLWLCMEGKWNVSTNKSPSYQEIFVYHWDLKVSLILSAVVYICGPLETFLNIMKLFQSEIQDPENYAIFYLDVYAESLTDRKPWQNSDSDWADPIKIFKVRWTQKTRTHAHKDTCIQYVAAAVHLFGSLLLINWDCVQILCRFIECELPQVHLFRNWTQGIIQNHHLAWEMVSN